MRIYQWGLTKFLMCMNKSKVMLRVSFDRESIVQVGFLPTVGTIKAYYYKALRYLTFKITSKRVKIYEMSLERLCCIAKYITKYINLLKLKIRNGY